ncbi:MAG: lipase maturation factor family protein, partial [Verrucomicrobiota bacterium]|nr:lipase maturation factor family protein [Verrucomicrobiota bacterium]
MNSPTPPPVRRVRHPPAGRPLMVFDGDCDFCRHWIARWQQATGERVGYAEYQQAGQRFPEISHATFQQAVQLIEPDGRVSGGADAVFRLLDFAPGIGRISRLSRRLPGFMPAARAVYRFIAAHRGLFSVLTRLLWGRTFSKPKYLFARWLFVRMLGVVYLIAFVSLAVQILGLIGKRGILPAQSYLDAARAPLGRDRFWLLPTACWWNASDGFLLFLCWLGAAVSALVIVTGVWPGACLALLWASYLSLCVAGRVFMSYQWDALLLETGLLAIFLNPPTALRPRWNHETASARVGRWLLLWLAFRITFESGLVKLSSGDPTWRNLTALGYHYETQPLPLATAWYANQLPPGFQKMSCALMFGIELGAPFLIFGPRNLRRVGAGAMASLQLLIAATGNYTFFNLLTCSLYLLLLDDDVWPPGWRAVLVENAPRPAGRFHGVIHGGLLAPVALLHTVLSLVPLVAARRARVAWPEPIAKLHSAVAPFRSCNGYGLFAVMTTSRPEIVIEGSDDGVTWLPYEFKWKPGDVDRKPGWCQPHQPRLDWQMWFAALGDFESAPWLYHLLGRLLEGSPEVLRLLERNPFPQKPPQYVHALLYQY